MFIISEPYTIKLTESFLLIMKINTHPDPDNAQILESTDKNLSLEGLICLKSLRFVWI